jgi:hypothetical protein
MGAHNSVDLAPAADVSSRRPKPISSSISTATLTRMAGPVRRAPYSASPRPASSVFTSTANRLTLFMSPADVVERTTKHSSATPR